MPITSKSFYFLVQIVSMSLCSIFIGGRGRFYDFYCSELGCCKQNKGGDRSENGFCGEGGGTVSPVLLNNLI